MLQNYIIGHIRTLVPLGVGWLLTYGAEKWHIVISPSTNVALSAFAVTAISAVYYVAARFLEHLWAPLGALLGVPAKPNYAPLLEDGTAVITSLVPSGPDPLAIEGKDPNTPGASHPDPVT